MPRAGPLRYWTLTLMGAALVLASGAAVVWGTYHLIGTGTCGTPTTAECSSETALHILAVVAGPLAGGAGGVVLALRGAGARSRILGPFRRRERRVADMVARGEIAAPTVTRPSTPAPRLPESPPATWQPAATASATPKSPVERLQELDRLKEKGLIGAAAYESQKRRILGGA